MNTGKVTEGVEGENKVAEKVEWVSGGKGTLIGKLDGLTIAERNMV